MNASDWVRNGVPIWRMELCGAGATVRAKSRTSWRIAIGIRTALVEEAIRNLFAFYEVMGYLLSILKSTRIRPQSTRKQAAIIMKSGTAVRIGRGEWILVGLVPSCTQSLCESMSVDHAFAQGLPSRQILLWRPSHNITTWLRVSTSGTRYYYFHERTKITRHGVFMMSMT